MAYTAASINNTPTIVAPAAAQADVRCRAIKLDANGKAAIAGAGEVAIGIALITNDEVTEAGHDVDIQIKECGLAVAGDVIKAGAALASKADGSLAEATDGQFVVATALESAEAAGRFINVQITKYQK